MALYAPQIDQAGTNQTAEMPVVTVDPKDIVNLGTSIKALLDSTVKPEPEINPETKEPVEQEPVPTLTSPDSGLSIQTQAFLDTIASAEGTGGDYNIIVGGKKFEGYEQHPNVVGLVTRAGPSTAAGKYQITKQTWDYLQKKYSDLEDFSPQNQDKAAFYLAKERYKANTKGRDLEADLAAGNTTYLREALQKTWTGIIVDKDFENRLGRNIKSRSTTIYKPVGFTTIKYTNQEAIRNKPVVPELETKLDIAVSSVLGTGYTVEIYSGGQEKGNGTGTLRHNEDEQGLGLAADVKIYDAEGKQVTDRKTLDKVKTYWLDNGYGSVGTYKEGMGIHFDVWTKDKLKPGMGLTWSY
jgi:muramidase (phage lysozyme)